MKISFLFSRFLIVPILILCHSFSTACCQGLPKCEDQFVETLYSKYYRHSFYHRWAPAEQARLLRQSPGNPASTEPEISDDLIRQRLKKQAGELKDASPQTDFSRNWEWAGDFSHADLAYADLRYVSFDGADLTAADLLASNLEHTRFLFDIESESKPPCYLVARLNGALLLGTKLAGSIFGPVDFAHAVFEPSSLPSAQYIASAQNLHLLTFATDPTALVQLRKSFRDSGFEQQSRQVTYALKRRQAEIELLSCCPSCKPSWPLDTVDPIVLEAGWGSLGQRASGSQRYEEIAQHCLAYVANRIGLDMTCQYGLNTLRPIKIGAAIWLICSLVFLGFVHHGGASGLYLVRAKGISLDPGVVDDAVQIRPDQASGLSALIWREFGLVRQTMFFSLMNGVNLGFKDIDLGRWLRLLPRREMDIRAVGWARTVAGLQALCTLYLVALWVVITFAPASLD